MLHCILCQHSIGLLHGVLPTPSLLFVITVCGLCIARRAIYQSLIGARRIAVVKLGDEVKYRRSAVVPTNACVHDPYTATYIG